MEYKNYSSPEIVRRCGHGFGFGSTYSIYYLSLAFDALLLYRLNKPVNGLGNKQCCRSAI